jgi:hypothetical protein
MLRDSKLKEWYENLSMESLNEITDYYDENSFFKDPFNEFYGRENIKKVFIHMFENLENPHFVFIDIISSDEQTFISWDFKFSRDGKEYNIHGSTHLKWKENKIVSHRDYWDVGEELLLKLPIIKSLYGFLCKKLKVV